MAKTKNVEAAAPETLIETPADNDAVQEVPQEMPIVDFIPESQEPAPEPAPAKVQIVTVGDMGKIKYPDAISFSAFLALLADENAQDLPDFVIFTAGFNEHDAEANQILIDALIGNAKAGIVGALEEKKLNTLDFNDAGLAMYPIISNFAAMRMEDVKTLFLGKKTAEITKEIDVLQFFGDLSRNCRLTLKKLNFFSRLAAYTPTNVLLRGFQGTEPCKTC